MKEVLIAMLLVMTGLIACSSDESKSLNREQAFTIFSSAMSSAMDSSDSAVDAAMGGGSGSMMNIAPGEPSMTISTYALDWWNTPANTVHVTGSLTYNDSPVNYDYTATVSFANFVCDDGSVINGSSTDDFNGNDTTFNAHIYGDMDVTYQGEGYDFSWNFTMACTATSCTYGGSFTIGGETYPLEGMESE